MLRKRATKCGMCGGSLADIVVDSVERLKPGHGTVVIRNVPAHECRECGEVWWPASSIDRMEEVITGNAVPKGTALLTVPAYEFAG